MSKPCIKELLKEAKGITRKAKELVYELLDEPMTDKQKEKILKLFRLLK